MGLWDKLMGNGIKEAGEGIGVVMDKSLDVAKGIKTLITGKVPPDVQMQFDLKMEEMEKGLLQGQLQLNLIDAQSGSMFKGGWRPATGWVCVFALLWHYIIFPLFIWVSMLLGSTIQPPKLDVGELIGLLFALLGMSGLRGFEKLRGVASK